MSDFVHGDQADRKHPHHPAEHDLEAGSSDKETKFEGVVTDDVESAEVIKAREIRENVGFLRKLRRGEEWLDEKMGVETQGIDRIHEEDKKPPSILNVFFLWWSLTCHVGTLPIGVLGPEFGLSLNQSVAAIIVGTVLGALCTSYCGTLGPKASLSLLALLYTITNCFSLVFVPLQPLDTPSVSMALNSAPFSTWSLVEVSLLSILLLLARFYLLYLDIA